MAAKMYPFSVRYTGLAGGEMRRIAWICIMTAAALAVLVPVASAQRQRQPSGPTAEARERAREAYGRGQRLFNEGNFEDAEAAFLEAYDAVPNPVVLVGVGESRERLDNVEGAIEIFQRYLTERPDAPDRARIEGKIEALRNRPGTLVISSRPAGATIVLDGVPTDEVTPAEVEASAGEHSVELRFDTYDPASETVQVTAGGRHEVSLELAPSESGEDTLGDEGEGGGLGDTAPPTEPADEGRGVGAGVWVASAFAGAGLIAGTVLGFLALSEQADFDAMPSDEIADSRRDARALRRRGFRCGCGRRDHGGRSLSDVFGRRR